MCLSCQETWFDALSICRTINQGNFSLLKIEDNGKSHQLQNYFKKRTFGNSTVNGFQALNYWIAGKRNYDQTDQWTWVASEKAIDFTAWAPGQPDNNNYYGEEHCIELLHFTQTGLFWNDANCLIKKQFICESL